MSYDLDQVTTAYDTLTSKIKADLDEQYTLGRIKGTDYATVYSQLMATCIQLAFEAPVKDAQVQLYERQKQGFDDNFKFKMFDSQMNAWSVMYSSGMLTTAPSIITNDELSTLYTNFKTEFGIS